MKETPYPIHWHDNDTGELYRAYQKLSDIIEGSKGRYRKTRDNSGIRDLCQMWIDGVRARQDANTDRLPWVDDLKYFLKGQLRRRRSWRATFIVVVYSLAEQLDAIDGGPESQEGPRIGFHTK
jgi:hypothetical protein